SPCMGCRRNVPSPDRSVPVQRIQRFIVDSKSSIRDPTLGWQPMHGLPLLTSSWKRVKLDIAGHLHNNKLFSSGIKCSPQTVVSHFDGRAGFLLLFSIPDDQPRSAIKQIATFLIGTDTNKSHSDRQPVPMSGLMTGHRPQANKSSSL